MIRRMRPSGDAVKWLSAPVTPARRRNTVPRVTPAPLVTSNPVLRLNAARPPVATHVAGALTVAAAATVVPATEASAARTAARGASPAAQPWPGHPDRAIVRHQVRPGDTATGLAVRYHAWTAELLRLNRLGERTEPSTRVRCCASRSSISAVRARRRSGAEAAARPSRRRSRPSSQAAHQAPDPQGEAAARAQHHPAEGLAARRPDAATRSATWSPGWPTATTYPRTLALAIAWQESGWQQRRVSSAGALGVMQVMPDTGRWMRWYAGRKLRLRDTHDNIMAGMLTLRTLRSWTTYDNNAIAAYYQGLGAVRRARPLPRHQAVRPLGARPPAQHHPHRQPDLRAQRAGPRLPA